MTTKGLLERTTNENSYKSLRKIQISTFLCDLACSPNIMCRMKSEMTKK